MKQIRQASAPPDETEQDHFTHLNTRFAESLGQVSGTSLACQGEVRSLP
ncbi:hypothetical protein ABZ957_36340 [Streptomyces sp. NPDC046316]